MKRPPIRITKPAVLPVSLSDALKACGVEAGEDDDAIKLQSEAATERLDGYRGHLGRALINQTWRQDFDLRQRGWFRLPFPDVSEATAQIVTADGASRDIGVLVDEDAISPFVRIVGSVAGSAWVTLRVTFIAGFGDAPDDVPAAIRDAILLDVGHRYQATSADGRLRSETVEGVSTTAFNSPEQQAIGIERLISDRLRPYRRGNRP